MHTASLALLVVLASSFLLPRQQGPLRQDVVVVVVVFACLSCLVLLLDAKALLLLLLFVALAAFAVPLPSLLLGSRPDEPARPLGLGREAALCETHGNAPIACRSLSQLSYSLCIDR